MPPRSTPPPRADHAIAAGEGAAACGQLHRPHRSQCTGAELPRLVRDEFEAFLECGILAHGFLRMRCGECGYDRLLAFSCKRRGFCTSCVHGACRRRRRTWWITSSRMCPGGSGCCPCRSRCARCWPRNPSWSRRCCKWCCAWSRGICWMPPSSGSRRSRRRGHTDPAHRLGRPGRSRADGRRQCAADRWCSQPGHRLSEGHVGEVRGRWRQRHLSLIEFPSLSITRRFVSASGRCARMPRAFNRFGLSTVLAIRAGGAD